MTTGNDGIAAFTAAGSHRAQAAQGEPVVAPTPGSWQIPEDMDADEWRDWYASLDPDTVAEHRDEIAVSGLYAGLTLAGVGQLYGVTRERIRQIVNRQGVIPRDLRRNQKEQAERWATRLARRIYDTSLGHPELTVAELADWWDTDERTVRAALGHRLAVHEPQERPPAERTSDDELLAALRAWAAETDVFTGDSYSEWAEARGWPGKQTVAIRMGSWNNALHRAGLGEHIRNRGGLRPQVSDAALWAGVLEFMRSDLPSYTFRAFVDYARDNGLGSGATIRNRLGQWLEVVDRVRTLMRYAADPDGSWEWADDVLATSPRHEPRAIISRDEAVASLARVAPRISGPVTVAAYETVRGADDVHANLIQRRCGSWVQALLAAGLEHRMSGKARDRLQAARG